MKPLTKLASTIPAHLKVTAMKLSSKKQGWLGRYSWRCANQVLPSCYKELKQNFDPYKVVIATIGILFMTVGIPANIMILFVTTFDTKTKKTPSTIFMNNFAIADLVMLLFRSISVDFRLKQFPFQWDYGKLLCFMESTLELVVSVVSVSMIMLMALDRYGAIKSYKYMQVSPYFPRLSRYRPNSGIIANKFVLLHMARCFDGLGVCFLSCKPTLGSVY